MAYTAIPAAGGGVTVGTTTVTGADANAVVLVDASGVLDTNANLTYESGVLHAKSGAAGLQLDGANGKLVLRSDTTKGVTLDAASAKLDWGGFGITVNAGGTVVTRGALIARIGGTLDTIESDAGTPASTTETDLHSLTVLANTLTTAGDTAVLETVLTFAANANTKRVRVYFGAAVIYDSTAVAKNGGSLVVRTAVKRTGAATQIAWATAVDDASATRFATVAAFATATESLAGGVVYKVTGQNGAASANDIVAKSTNWVFVAGF